ncbi:sulfotransferase family protein [Alteromonas sp. KS69]|uniref:sulfotransferase family protein n=1 Tax=Alteromonas sp. KS69 TaxID=2109917 RepID=UPI000F881AB0|nr:sulfotransferase [Alteromonas sp. KS69]RUP83093.1 sulfotransferase family protein [Alteromonas sp. KS69]
MKWSYFIEADNTASIIPFEGPAIGLTTSSLSLQLSKELGDIDNVEVSIASHSALLHGEQNLSNIEFDKSINKVSLGLENLPSKVVVLKVLVHTTSSVAVFHVALLPSFDLPQAVFVLGSPRSGTTVVGNMLQRGMGIKSHGESHMAELLATLVTTATDYVKKSPASGNKGTLTWEVESIYVKALQVQQFRELYSSYYPGKVFIDKTPGIPMLNSLPILMLAYPNAKVIYCQRRGIENIESRLRKFPQVPFEGHCRQWRQAMLLWRRNKQVLSSQYFKAQNWFMDVEQFRLAKNPSEVIKSLAQFLNLDNSAYERMLHYQATETPQKTGSSDFSASSLESVKWSEEQKAVFKDICNDEMQRSGYSLDNTYFV